MLLKMKENGHGHSILKAMSWRAVAAIDTFGIAFLVTGKLIAAASVVGVEVITKTAIFYFHERAWVFFGKRAKAFEPALA